MSCAINAACLALLNSSVDLKFMVAGVSCVIDELNQIHLDPDLMVEEKARASFLFVFDSVDKNIVISYALGTFSTEEYREALGVCREASKDVFEYYKSVVSKK